MPNDLKPGATRAIARPGRRFRPRAVPTVATLIAVALFVGAGNWQRGRMHSKESLRAAHDAFVHAAPVPLASIDRTADWTSQRFRPVVVSGEYDASRQILIDNRIDAGRAGYHVVTPILVDGATAVLVDRGWIAAGPTRAVLPVAPPPVGPVAVQGRLNLPEGYLELKTETPDGVVWQNLDPARFAVATGLPVLPVVLQQTVPPIPDDGLARNWPAPDFGVEKHRIYMLQWYAFAALAVTLWLTLNWRTTVPDTAHG